MVEGGPKKEVGQWNSEGQLLQMFMKSLGCNLSGPGSHPFSLCGDVMTFVQDPEINLRKGIHVLGVS